MMVGSRDVPDSEKLLFLISVAHSARCRVGRGRNREADFGPKVGRRTFAAQTSHPDLHAQPRNRRRAREADRRAGSGGQFAEEDRLTAPI